MVTTNDLKVLRARVLSTHPWHSANVRRIVSNIRRAFGEETWVSVSNVLAQVQESKDIELWRATIDPLFSQLMEVETVKKEAEQEVARKVKERQQLDEVIALAKKKQQEAAAQFVSSHFKAAKNTTVIRRERKL